VTQPAPARRRTGAWILASVLLLIGILGALIVPIYARSTPFWGAFPFFYWYQLIWVPVVAVLSGLAYVLTRPSGRLRPGSGQPPGPPRNPTRAGDPR